MALGGGLSDDAGKSPTPWLVAGGTLAGLSALALVVPTANESMMLHFDWSRATHTEDEAKKLDRAWAQLADEARFERTIGGTLALILGTASATAGAIIVAGGADLSDADRRVLGGSLLGAGIGVSLGGLTGLLLPSPTESAYQSYRSATRASTLSVTASGSPGGGGIQLSGAF